MKIFSLASLQIALAVSALVWAQGVPKRPSPQKQGIIVQAKGDSRGTFVPWVSSSTIQDALNLLRRKQGGYIQWLPGRYEIPQALHIRDSKDIRIQGTLETQLFFPDEPVKKPRLLKEVTEGQTTLQVDRASQLQVGWKYQAYPENGKGDRVLQFRVVSIDGTQVTISPAVDFMSHVKSIPKGCMLLEHVNFFEVDRSENITIAGLTLDGLGRGDVDGHTTYSGIIAVGKQHADKRPASTGLTIENCTFKDLKGRGLAVYRSAGVLVQGCHFENIRTQALELDHFTKGKVTGNTILNSGVGIALNDAFESEVEFNTIIDCQVSISIYKHFSEPWVNTKHTISNNHIQPAKGCYGVAFSHPMRGNRVINNFFTRCNESRWVTKAEGNLVEGNRSLSD